jgi:hypothetical protein
MRRGNQFVALKGGVPATKAEAFVFQRRQAMQAQVKAGYEAVMSKIDTPSGFTALKNKQNTMSGATAVVHGPYQTQPVQLSEIASRSALQKISDTLLKQSKVNYLDRAIGAGRENLMTALKLMGHEEEVERIKGLSDFQFDVFWFGTNIAESVFMKYHADRDRIANPTKKETWQEVEAGHNAEELGIYISFAENLQRDRPDNYQEPSEIIRGRKR